MTGRDASELVGRGSFIGGLAGAGNSSFFFLRRGIERTAGG